MKYALRNLILALVLTHIYVVFFTLTGAALDVSALRSTWMVALLLVVVRGALMCAGGYLGHSASSSIRLARPSERGPDQGARAGVVCREHPADFAGSGDA